MGGLSQGEMMEGLNDENERLREINGELVKALRELATEAHRNMTGGAGHLIDNAWAAIAKAEGRS